jgi:hypothetical protein
MPKKTRQEKIVAQLRRLQNLQEKAEEPQSLNKPQTVSLGSLEQTLTATTKTTEINYSHVLSDLKKTLLFAVAAIVCEIALSLTIL